MRFEFRGGVPAYVEERVVLGLNGIVKGRVFWLAPDTGTINVEGNGRVWMR